MLVVLGLEQQSLLEDEACCPQRAAATWAMLEAAEGDPDGSLSSRSSPVAHASSSDGGARALQRGGLIILHALTL